MAIFRDLLLTLGASKGPKDATFDAPRFLGAVAVCAVGNERGHAVMSHLGVQGERLGRDRADRRRCSIHSHATVHTIWLGSLFRGFDFVQYLTGEESDFLQVHFLQVQGHQFLVKEFGVLQQKHQVHGLWVIHLPADLQYLLCDRL